MATATNHTTTPTWTECDRLRKAREHAGLKQSELADLIGLSRTSISNYESGTTHPKRPVLLSYALATGVPLEWLTGTDQGVCHDCSAPLTSGNVVSAGISGPICDRCHTPNLAA